MENIVEINYKLSLKYVKTIMNLINQKSNQQIMKIAASIFTNQNSKYDLQLSRKEIFEKIYEYLDLFTYEELDNLL